MKKQRSAVRPQGISFGGGEGRGGRAGGGGRAGERSPGFYVCVRPSASLRKSDKKNWILDVTSWHASKWQKEMRRSPLAPPSTRKSCYPLSLAPPPFKSI